MLHAAQICSHWEKYCPDEPTTLAKHTTQKALGLKNKIISFECQSKRHIVAVAVSGSGNGGMEREGQGTEEEKKKGRLGHLLFQIMEPAWL